MKRVYIAGKLADYAPKYNMNRKRMMQTAIDVINAGFSVFVPSLIEQLALVDEEDWDYNDYFNNSQPWLKVSDAVFLVPGWEDSEGTKKEIKEAKALNIPVFDCIDCLISYFEQDEIAKKIGNEIDLNLLNPSPTAGNPEPTWVVTNNGGLYADGTLYTSTVK